MDEACFYEVTHFESSIQFGLIAFWEFWNSFWNLWNMCWFHAFSPRRKFVSLCHCKLQWLTGNTNKVAKFPRKYKLKLPRKRYYPLKSSQCEILYIDCLLWNHTFINNRSIWIYVFVPKKNVFLTPWRHF